MSDVFSAAPPGSPPAGGTDLALAQGGDEAAFTRLVEPHRRELHAHCYRMLGSGHDADDAVQDAMLRAWRGLGALTGGVGSLRSWLYTIATRSSLTIIEQRGRRALPVDLGPASQQAVVGDRPLTEVAWLGPYPDLGPAEASVDPEARYGRREAVELALVAALQELPGNQRAALLLFDVVGFSVAEIATLMQTTTTSVNSALARARRTLSARVEGPSQQEQVRALGDERVRTIVDSFASALENGDVEALVALLTEDVTWSMPPMGHWYRGLTVVADFAATVPMRCGSWRHVPIQANGQPALASFLRAGSSGVHQAWSIDVLTLRGDRVAEVTSFVGGEHFAAFGLPRELP